MKTVLKVIKKVDAISRAYLGFDDESVLINRFYSNKGNPIVTGHAPFKRHKLIFELRDFLKLPADNSISHQIGDKFGQSIGKEVHVNLRNKVK